MAYSCKGGFRPIRRILEDGSHQELVAAGARYAHLFSLQALGYLS